MIAALSGTATDRNTTIRSRNDSTTTAPMTHGSRRQTGGRGVDPGGGLTADEGR